MRKRRERINSSKVNMMLCFIYIYDISKLHFIQAASKKFIVY